MKIIKKYITFVFIFIGILFFNLFIGELSMDEIWNYGFSYNIVNGLIPYKDFNMVITPFYPMFMATIMLISKSYIFFHIVNAFIPTIIMFFAYKLIENKAFILLPLLIFPSNIISPSYNVLILLLFILLIYLEKNKKNDYLIGVLLSIIFLTKQSIGILLIPMSLYYFKEPKKILKRFIGLIIPIIIFIVYLLITNSYKEFIDLCILGLFDFGKSNGNITIFFAITVALIMVLLVLIKNNKNIYYLYLLGFISMCAPLFDINHTQIFMFAYIIIIVLINDVELFKPKLIGLLLFSGLLCLYTIKSNININDYPNNLNIFKYRYIEKNGVDNTNEVLKYMKKYNNKVMFIGPVGYYYKLIANEKTTYIDLINEGNFGYNGSKKLLDMVKGLDDDYVFFINISDNPDAIGTQTDKKLLKYILKNYKKVDETRYYDIYMKQGLK